MFTVLTGRAEAPTETATEAWFIMGRRSGKDVKVASIATYLATIGASRFRFQKRLKPGERGVVQVLAVDRDQARVCLGYLKAMFEKPMLAPLVKSNAIDGIELTNRLSIEITTNDQRRVRGRTVVAAVFDGVAHWRGDDSANPDEAIYQAVKPAMATMMPGAMFVGISSPHARTGLLYRKYRDHFGKDGDVLVAKAPTWVMNPTVARDSKIVCDAFDSDAAWAAAEYGAEFRSDIEAFLSRDVLEACVDVGIHERPADRSRFRYLAFTDPSGGSADSMTLSIGHIEKGHVVIDLVREIVPPFNPEAAVMEFASTVRQYGLSMVIGDNYGAVWVKDAFMRAGVYYHPSDRAKSALYLDALAAFNARKVALLDHLKTVNQFAALERRATRGGRDTVDHPRGAHDDIANSVAGVIANLSRQVREEAQKVDVSKPQPDQAWVLPVAPDVYPSRTSRLRV